MSITSCVLLFLLCLSLHACSVRLLGSFDSKNKLERKLHFSIKNDMSKSTAVVEVKSSSSKVELRSIQEKSIQGSHAADDSQKLEDADNKTVENEKENSSGALQTNKKSAVSVSWRVPHRKRGEKDPGFNLDYSPPKTHPPSHN